jgi:hypothetical protein
MASRLSTVAKRVTCNRCRSIAGTAHTWAQKNARTRSSRKPPKQARRPVGKAPELAAGFCAADAIVSGDYTPEQVRKALGPNAEVVLHEMLGASVAKNVIDRMIKQAKLEPSPGVGDMPRMVEVSAERLARLEAVYSFASELCDAIDRAEEDIGGSRPTKDIVADLGPAVGYVDELSRRVRDENAG